MYIPAHNEKWGIFRWMSGKSSAQSPNMAGWFQLLLYVYGCAVWCWRTVAKEGGCWVDIVRSREVGRGKDVYIQQQTGETTLKERRKRRR